jgi:hypothetical protein
MVLTCMHMGSRGGMSGPHVWTCGMGKASRPGRRGPRVGMRIGGAAWEIEHGNPSVRGMRHGAGVSVQTWTSVWTSRR